MPRQAGLRKQTTESDQRFTRAVCQAFQSQTFTQPTKEPRTEITPPSVDGTPIIGMVLGAERIKQIGSPFTLQMTSNRFEDHTSGIVPMGMADPRKDLDRNATSSASVTSDVNDAGKERQAKNLPRIDAMAYDAQRLARRVGQMSAFGAPLGTQCLHGWQARQMPKQVDYGLDGPEMPKYDHASLGERRGGRRVSLLFY